ncbi:MAG: pirin family protein [Halothece sp.]
MIAIRKANERGHANHGWLDTYHTFSFANYYDPNNLGFRSLRVINEDWVQPDAGFPTHGHQDMEIITYVLEGTLEHQDNLGNGSIIYPGDVQKMSAGTGILHSEFNPSKTDPVHLLQIWIIPDQKGIKPAYEQHNFSIDQTPGKLKLIASKKAEGDCISVQQDVNCYLSMLISGDVVTYNVPPERHVWLQVVKGAVTVNDTPLSTSDGVAVSEENALTIEATEDAEILLFDLA